MGVDRGVPDILGVCVSVVVSVKEGLAVVEGVVV